MRRVAVTITGRQQAALKAMAQRLQIPLSEALRRIIDESDLPWQEDTIGRDAHGAKARTTGVKTLFSCRASAETARPLRPVDGGAAGGQARIAQASRVGP